MVVITISYEESIFGIRVLIRSGYFGWAMFFSKSQDSNPSIKKTAILPHNTSVNSRALSRPF
jgi:hypothetical protein